MASLAVDLTVTAIQREEILVVKIPHAVNAIMALKTFGAKLSLVLGDKVLVLDSMASSAGTWLKFIHTIQMAAHTGNGFT
jgi:hypothetical protein